MNAALMAHDCIGNTFLSVDDDFSLTVKASVNISEKSPIYFNYANPLSVSITSIGNIFIFMWWKILTLEEEEVNILSVFLPNDY